MQIENKMYVFVINNVKICKCKMKFYVSSNQIDNMASDVSTDIPSGEFNSVRFDIDGSYLNLLGGESTIQEIKKCINKSNLSLLCKEKINGFILDAKYNALNYYQDQDMNDNN